MDKDKRIEELEKQNQQLTETIKQLQQKLKNKLKLLSSSMPVFLEKKRKN
ncbi:hypothetical protein O2U01_04105 [Ligilactobacillus salivarius]|uniref:Transposase n=1 Tax=Ligilactobacillus salivarius TaxID=1624 RepID=A0ABD7YTS8_9LACO|nr:hypothetical protein [Ligilactobacillus salivarius]WHS05985.1 hypothetical protein O2U07_10540 [Ligilactobacillus salivarius]WHS06579.1 hypothetical protein O2U07_04685 [Ligilactobacillus salivarius]WHS13892.1 hypothetical protein O2U03_08360 [Ligilactobacillus salivarius]WHS14480.1 hypothetical protein O2U03_02235 [Ligilactobacillus salivarius]WHS16904.1 hypothetical protein O2U02_05205 [Ligilactobacillus salivarius]